MKEYETYIRKNNRWAFVGWNTIQDDKFIINKKENKKFIYITYKWLNNEIEEYRYSKGDE